MLKKLRLHLTVLCVVMTGVVLVSLAAGMNWLSIAQSGSMSALLFQNSVTAMVNQLRMEPVLDPEWVAVTEAAQACVIAMENNGYPLELNGEWPREGRETLVEQARARAKEEGLDYKAPPLTGDLRQVTFSMGRRYRCAVVQVPVGNDWLSLTVVADRSAENGGIARQTALCALLTLTALGILCLVSYRFTGRAIRPTAQSMEKQREFVASASHELRSPLTLIETTASSIAVEPDRTPEFVRIIKNECGRMGRLINDLLLLANTDTASWRLQRQEVDLTTLLLDVTEEFEERAAREGMRLTLALPEEPLSQVRGDAQRLAQVVSILLDNAVSHSKSAAVELGAKQEKQEISITVADHGCGIGAEDRERVFDRFYRGDKSRKDKAHFGLGLAVAKELTELHGGGLRLWETPGGGCTFEITLPLHKTV